MFIINDPIYMNYSNEKRKKYHTVGTFPKLNRKIVK